ncbi:hypothetical protein SDC9_159321 [bioreactor metagenome]|uniref:Uncharacterized protein n=1 Tax=bioreactor metagenome TaxID=1076179 RepID=A0A645FCG1_9ZZZZ
MKPYYFILDVSQNGVLINMQIHEHAVYEEGNQYKRYDFIFHVNPPCKN